MMTILKNVLLILLMVLILHFMIKNRIIEEKNAFKRKLIHYDTIRSKGGYRGDPATHQEQREVIQKVTDAGSGVISAANMDASREALGDALMNDPEPAPEPQPEEKELLDSIETPVIAPSTPQIKPDKMKELYDFVYADEETHTSNDSINKYFPDNVKDSTRVDHNETTEHSKRIIDKLKAQSTHSTCNFEVIGSMCASKGDGILGIEEQSTASFYSEL